jgi:beta-glucosidase
VFPESFIWGAATAAHQIEGGNTNNNWYQFETLDSFKGKTKGPSGQAADSYRRYEEDADLGRALGLNSYRLSIEWSRVEPKRDQWDEVAFAHYGAVIDAVVSRGMRPMITLHHFTDPIWVNDLSQYDACAKNDWKPLGEQNLCGWANNAVREEFVEFVAEVARRFGDRVDDWITFNEPTGLLSAGYMYGAFPPGRTLTPYAELALPVLRQLLQAHAEAYDAIHGADKFDADADGRAAQVGFSQAVGWYVPADSNNAEHVVAAEQAVYFMHYLFVDALIHGGLDADLDQVQDEVHEAWKGKLDYLGLQYYFRAPTTYFPLLPPIVFAPCLSQIEASLPGALELLNCPAIDPGRLTTMGYEHAPEGLYQVGRALAARYPTLPLLITENGIATQSGKRRAQSLVRHLEEAHRLIEDGVDLRGYYHWSLIDNFEWAEGYSQRFGLYRVDYQTFARSETEGATVYRQILAAGGTLSPALRSEYGGDGSLDPEPMSGGEP